MGMMRILQNSLESHTTGIQGNYERLQLDENQRWDLMGWGNLEGLPLEYSCVWLRNKRNQWQILSSTKSWQLFTNMDSILLTVGWFASMFTRFFDTAELCLYSFSWEIGWKQILVVLLRWREFEARSVAVFLLTCHRGGGGRCQSHGC